MSGIVGGASAEAGSGPASGCVREHPGVLRAAALRAVHDHRSLAQRDPGQAARHDLDLVAVDGERAQVHVPGGQRAVGQRGRDGREGHGRLGDPALGRLLDEGALVGELVARGERADEHPLAAGLAGRLDHQLVDVLEGVRALLGVRQQPGLEVVEDRLLADVVPDHLGHVVVDGLVVGHPGAHRVRDRHVARSIDAHQAGHAEQRVRPELERVHEVVVDPAVDRVDPGETAGGADVAGALAHHEVGRLDELHAHLAREERVLEVGAVRGAGRPDDHHRVLAAARGRAPQRVQQQRRVVAHRAHVVAREQLRQETAHGDPVLEHVRDPGRRAHVVLEHLPASVRVAHQVAAGHVAPDAAGRPDAVRRAREGRPRDHQLPGHDAVPQDLLLVVHVVDEQVDRAHALRETALDGAPLGRRQDARHEVEREGAILDRPVGAGCVEGDPLLDEDRVAPLARRAQALAAEPAKGVDERGRRRARLISPLEELVEEPRGGGVVDLAGGHALRHRRLVVLRACRTASGDLEKHGDGKDAHLRRAPPQPR